VFLSSLSSRRCLSALLATLIAAPPVFAQAPSKPPAPPKNPAGEPATVDGGWPRVVKTTAGTFTLYQPQLDAWDGYRLEFRAAVSIAEKEGVEPIFGVVWGTAKTELDHETRLVSFHERVFKKAVFPSAASKQDAWLAVMQKEIAPNAKAIALDRLAAMLEVAEADKAMKALSLKNDPPRIVFAKVPTILVYVDGAPAWRPVKDTKLERAINTRMLVVKDQKGVHYVKVFDGWLEAPSFDGPWVVEKKPGKDLDKAVKDAKASGQVDLVPGGNPEDPKTQPTLKRGTPPALLVVTSPTELVVTEGEPNFVPVKNTQLVYVDNTKGNIFKYLGDQKTYVLTSGRWFRAATTDGPWEFVESTALPKDFAQIPDDSAKENVKASVAGTPQAKEALIANSLPQTAAVKKAEAKIDPPKFDGEPRLEKIDDTNLKYVVNSSTPIIQVENVYYAVQNGVWFRGASLQGPWSVATSVPTAIYTIPPSSPVHYVTYVRVYDETPDTVYVGYTPGYYGTCVSGTTVVYGTGYYYPPYVGTTVWYGPPVTYGSGVAMTYTPWTGWAFGFGFGWAWGSMTVGWGWGAYPWWGPVGWGYYYPYPYYRPAYWGGGAAWGPWGGGAVWGPGGWAATSGNVYSRWGNTSAVTRRSGGYNAWTGNAWRNSAGMSYNSRTGNLSAGQRSAVGNVYTGSYAYGSRGTTTSTRTGNTVSAGRVTGGNVYTGNQGSAGYVRGEQGGAVRVGDDVYAGRNGEVYRRDDSGWSQRGSDGSWSGVDRATTTNLDAQRSARTSGQSRVSGYDHSRASGYGSGYRSHGGGGMRGGGGRRR
jgi:hypothetical protein